MSNINDICCNPGLQDLVLAGWPPCCATSFVVVVRRRRRWAHAPVIHAASHFDHKKRVAWFPISMHTCGSFFYNYGAPLGGPNRRSSTINGSFPNGVLLYRFNWTRLPKTNEKITKLMSCMNFRIMIQAVLDDQQTRELRNIVNKCFEDE